MILQIHYRLELPVTSEIFASRVPSHVIVTAKVAFPSIHTETPNSVLASVAQAVSDRSLQMTTTFESRLDEYVLAQEKIAHILDTHKGIKCVGLTQGWYCNICNEDLNDPMFGAKLYSLNKKMALEEYKETREREPTQ